MKPEASTHNPPTFWELARQALSSTKRGYDLLAPKFEATPYATPGVLLDYAFERFDELVSEPRGSNAAADLACGTGLAARRLLKRGYTVDGFDFSPGMLERAAKSAGDAAGDGRLRIHCTDLEGLALPADFYSAVVIFGAWGHVLERWRGALLTSALGSLEVEGILLTVAATPAKPGSRRWWRTKLFDLAIRLRNLCWPGEFHMYYGLNQTPELLEAFRCAAGSLAPYAFTVRTEAVPLEKYRELSLIAVIRTE